LARLSGSAARRGAVLLLGGATARRHGNGSTLLGGAAGRCGSARRGAAVRQLGGAAARQGAAGGVCTGAGPAPGGPASFFVIVLWRTYVIGSFSLAFSRTASPYCAVLSDLGVLGVFFFS